ncbi:2-isopropylmalate synthase [Salinibacter ruber]|uniref:2-isopropylmalate synthase n=1 Tax=Salinibacter ruber TaxID=146919 RepID=UPI00216A0C0B|nr:2-isopropylmalate synthase [Salinibacter ruber]MCS3705113.1 2-isopropylmalate synthase [Salinibacter ruber]
MSDSITIFDTTLRDGEQAPGASMTVPEKVHIAHKLADLNVDVIEAGFPISSPAQTEAVTRIATEVDGPVTCALARTKEDDIDAAGEALADGTDTRLHTFIATSDVHIEAKFDKLGNTMTEKREAIIQRAVRAIEQALTYTDNVEFSAEDAGRTDLEFLCEVVQAAAEAGATTINIPDTTGYCAPSEYTDLLETVVDCLPDPDAVTLSTHCHDDLGLATANTLAGIRAGARQVECTINGIGERAGNAALEEIVMALTVRADAFDVTADVHTEHLTPTSQTVSAATGFPVQPNKAIVGSNAFSHEAGIHQHGVLEERTTYEIMSATDVGQDAEQIRLGRHSGRHGLFNRLEAMGYAVPEGHRDALYDRFLDLADRKKEVFEEDLEQMMNDFGGDAVAAATGLPDNGAALNGGTPAYRLDQFSVHLSSDDEAKVSVRLQRDDGSAREEQATGEGPVDALYRALDHAVDAPHTLVDYSIRSISEGADAQGEVEVTIRYGENQFAGTARNTDVIRASAEAYVDALNRLVAAQEHAESVEFVQNGIMHTYGE